jgi:two-component system LytT family response regulator
MELKQNKKISSEDVLYCEADSNYTIIHLLEAKRIIRCKTLSAVAYELQDLSLLRIHSKYLVNTQHISKISKDKRQVFLHNENIIPVARRRIGVLKELIAGSYLM